MARIGVTFGRWFDPGVGLSIFDRISYLTRMNDEEMAMQIPSSHQATHRTMFGNILPSQTIPTLRKAGPRMLSARFVTRVSVDAAHPEQRHMS